jgi:acyl-coenzyme A thioesterase PaaI-like protein
MKLFMLRHLPLGFFVGLRVIKLNPEQAQITVPYKYLNKNPFQSIYFAVLSMAAELSTGIIAIAAVYDASIPVSMLVYDMNAQFTKKATGKITFTCMEGKAIAEAVENSVLENVGKTVTVKSIGKDKNGTQVAEFNFTWTFKPKLI